MPWSSLTWAKWVESLAGFNTIHIVPKNVINPNRPTDPAIAEIRPDERRLPAPTPIQFEAQNASQALWAQKDR
jgi:hypothetical protein